MEHGAELFEAQERLKPTAEEQEPPPLTSEIEYAVKRLSTGKSPGLDGIPAELVKATGPFGIEMLHRLCTSIEESLPLAWRLENSGDHSTIN